MKMSSWYQPGRLFPMLDSSLHTVVFWFCFLFFLFCFVFCFVFLRQSFSVALEPVLELALVDQASLELRDPPASASQMLKLKVCVTTTTRLISPFFMWE